MEFKGQAVQKFTVETDAGTDTTEFIACYSNIMRTYSAFHTENY